MLHALNLGTTSVFGSAMVNSARFAVNKSTVDNNQNPFFCPTDVGVRNYHCYAPGYMVLAVTGAFDLYPGNQTEALFFNDSYNVSDDLTLVRGNHQFGFGGNVRVPGRGTTSPRRAPTARGASPGRIRGWVWPTSWPVGSPQSSRVISTG